MEDKEKNIKDDIAYNEMADEAVMGLVAAGDRDAFAALVKKYHVALLNFFRRMNVYTCDGDDLVQDTFLRLFNYREKYRPTARYTTFLYMMARQVQIDYFRKIKRRAILTDELEDESVEENRIRLSRDRQAETKEMVERALNTLSEEMRCVVVMSIYQGLKYGEIAEILEIPVGTVKTRMFYALQNLGKVIEHEG